MKTNVKSNLKTKILRFFQIVFVAIVCVTLTGCMGSDPDNPDTDTGGINIAGVKVLRKPLDGYDFDGNVPENDGTKDFYWSLSEDLLNYLFYIYGNLNYGEIQYESVFHRISANTDNEQVGELAQQFEENPDGFLYYYDAIRYQITSVAHDEASGNYRVTADTSKAWNWSLPISNASYSPWILAYNGSQNGNMISTTFEESGNYSFSYAGFKFYYVEGGDIQHTFIPIDFQTAYVNEDYINGLTYAIYSLVLGLQPNQMSVSYDSGLPVLTVEGYPATADQTSAERALEDVKILFNQLGSYVGLTERNKVAITNFVLDEIIGESAQVMPSLPSTYSYDLYYEDVVSAIVDYCGTLTTIGQASESTGEGETTVGDSFMASEVVDYPATSFFSMLEGDPFLYTGAHEYQSLVLIPDVNEARPTIRITDIWLDFKYDAGNDGDEIYDPNKYLEIEVSVRWWQVKTDEAGNVLSKTMRVVTKTIRVKDGPINEGEEGSYIEFELDVPERQGGFGETVKVGKFNCPEPLVPKEDRTVTITGKTDARKYYQVIESSTYGGYGVLNQELFDFSYCEVAFNVAKAPGDNQTNYAFYTAISNIYEPQKHENDPERH